MSPPTPTSWKRVQELVQAALDLPASDRSAFIEQVCGSNAGLRRQIEDLIQSYEQAGSFFENVIEAGAHQVIAADAPVAGNRIGAYELAESIGHGGMGAVYRATRADDQFRQQVAIKIIRSDISASPELLARFRAERQILASLTHPNIARLLDGGVTTSGLPYLVMEYIEGITVSRFVEERGLDVRERLEIFLQICAAVQHAHRNLIVHRDIKPANVLVTPDGTPKLLDFGIAKLLSPDGSELTTLTQPAERIMTLEYASPEQIRGEAVTTATDVYSLGVLLYELLTGQRAFNSATTNPIELQRRICEDDPVRPCLRNPKLDGELDAVVMMALRKEPSRRYTSVEQLSEDLQRYFKGLPVQARPDTFLYRAGKFGRRHVIGIGALAALILILVGGIVSTSVAQRRAEAAQVRAQTRFRNILAMANSSLFEIHDSVAQLPGSMRTRALVVSRTLQYLNMLSADSATEPALLRELAGAYEKLADLQFRDGPEHLGDSKGALTSAGQALALRQQVLKLEPWDQVSRLATASDTLRIADIQRLTRQGLSALAEYHSALQLYRQMAAEKPQDRRLRERIADTEGRYGDALRQAGDVETAQKEIRAAVVARKALLAEAPADPAARRGYEMACMVLGDLESEQLGDHKAAVETLSVSLAIARGLSAEFPQRSSYKTDLASVLSRLGNVHYKSREVDKAIPYYKESLATIKALAEADPGDGRARRSVAIHSTNLAQALNKNGQVKEAEALFRRSIAIQTQLLKGDPENIQHQNDLGYVEQVLGELLLHSGRLAEADDHLQAALTLRKGMTSLDSRNVEYQFRLASTYATIGNLRDKLGRTAEACASYRSSENLLAGLEGKIALGGEPKRISRLLAVCPP